jgi:hypothetical protein
VDVKVLLVRLFEKHNRMRSLSVCLLLLPLHIFAGDTTAHKNSFGIYTETNAAFAATTNPGMGTVGLVYKIRRSPINSFVATLGYTGYNDRPEPRFTSFNKDTAFSRPGVTKVGLVTAGFGIEAQRHFYRRVSLYAGAELRAGYGSGTTDTFSRTHYNRPYTNPANGHVSPYNDYTDTRVLTNDVTMVSANFTAYLGARVDIKRLSIGLQFMNGMRYENIMPDKGSGYSNLSWDLSNITQRLLFTYRL